MNKFILYGAGHDGIVTMKYLGKEKVAYFCDSGKYGSTVNGIPVIGPDQIKEKSKDNLVVIAVSKVKYVLEIAKTLLSLDIEFIFWQDLIDDLIRKEGIRYNELNTHDSFVYNKDDEYLVSIDRFSDAGVVESYFWQDLWAAQHINRIKPGTHYDIGSRLDGFITHLLSFEQKVTMIDIRPLDIKVDGLSFIQADATSLDNIEDESVESISALCSLEHFGLGRYGDDIDPEACFKCFSAIQEKVKTDGIAYISVPIGNEHLEFNAHRVFKPQTIIDAFEKMELIEFSSCCREQYEKNIDTHKYDEWTEHGGDRFGLFMFRKI